MKKSHDIAGWRGEDVSELFLLIPEEVQMFLKCFYLYLRRYNVWVEADVWLNRSSVSVISRPYLRIKKSSSGTYLEISVLINIHFDSTL